MTDVKFIIASTSYLLAKGIVSILSEITDRDTFRTINDKQELLPVLKTGKPQVLFLTEEMADKEIIKSLHHLKNLSQKPRTVLLIWRKTVPEEMLRITDNAVDIFDARENLINLFREILSEIIPYAGTGKISSTLTRREKDILREVAIGQTNKEIGEKLFISTHTVITHRKNITQKLGIKTVSGLTVYAILNKIVSLDEIPGKENLATN